MVFTVLDTLMLLTAMNEQALTEASGSDLNGQTSDFYPRTHKDKVG